MASHNEEENSSSLGDVEASREQTRAAPVRVLFVSMYHLGWKTWCHQLEKYSTDRDDMTAVHFRTVQPLWMKLLSAPLPKPFKRSLVPANRAWAFYLNQKLRTSILARQFDIIFVNSQILAPGLIDLCQVSNTKLAICLDVTGPAFVRDLLGEAVPPHRTWAEERTVYQAADMIVPWSSWIAKSLASDFQVPQHRILVSPPATIISEENTQSENTKLLRIFFCGNDWERKGGPRLLEWHQKHWSTFAELHIVSSKARLPSGLTNVISHGSVPNERLVKELLPAADIFCMPTSHDMSPFAISEAQAAGLPTVTSRIGGMADLVIHGETGYLLPPQDDEAFIDAITRLLQDKDLRLKMHRAAMRHASEHLNADIVFPRLLDKVLMVARTTRSASDIKMQSSG